MSDPKDSIITTALFSFVSLVSVLAFMVDMTFPRDFRSTVVMVSGNSGHGSGSIVKSTDRTTLVMTNRHVCDGVAYSVEEIDKIRAIMARGMVCMFDPEGRECTDLKAEYAALLKSISGMGRKVTVTFNNLTKSPVQGTIVKISDKYDLCLVRIDEGNLPVMHIAKNKAKPGDSILAIGNPLEMTNHQTQGFVGDQIHYQGNNYQHHSAPIYPGSSGGPTVNQDGEQVGVNTLGTQVPTQSYMIPVEDIKDFLKGI